MYTLDSTFKSEKNKAANQPIYLYTIHDYDSLRISGIATSTSTNHLVDTEANFVVGDVGRTIHNTIDDTYAIITAINSTIDITLSKNIMANGETYNLETNLYLAEYDTDITYDGITYTRFPIKHDEIGENSQGEIDNFKVSVANVNRLIQGYLETYDLRGKKITITLVWANQLADIDANIKFIYYIDSYTASQDTVEFVLSSKYDILDLELPLGRYNRNYCRWKFKSIECGYSNGQSTCDKRKATCKTTMSNIARYGGFPSVPTHRIFV
jgi:lambda family phage minor tail protein L